MLTILKSLVGRHNSYHAVVAMFTLHTHALSRTLPIRYISSFHIFCGPIPVLSNGTGLVLLSGRTRVY